MDTTPIFNHSDGGSKHSGYQGIASTHSKKDQEEHEDLNDLLDLGLDLDFETAYQIFSDLNDLGIGDHSSFHTDYESSFNFPSKTGGVNHLRRLTQIPSMLSEALDHNYRIPSPTTADPNTVPPQRPELRQTPSFNSLHGIQLPQPREPAINNSPVALPHRTQPLHPDAMAMAAPTFASLGDHNTTFPHLGTLPALRPQTIYSQNANYIPGGELLSTFESTAIEHFLDTLITNEPINDVNIVETENKTKQPIESSEQPTTPSVRSNSSSIIPEPQTESNDKIWTRNAEKVSVEDNNDASIKDNTSQNDSHLVDIDYIPSKIDIPDIRIDDSDIPPEAEKDPALLKKWKHVQVEKIRRDQTKILFNELVGLLRDGIDGHGKRVPKYLLLSGIVKDIKGLVSANRELEQIFQNMGG